MQYIPYLPLNETRVLVGIAINPANDNNETKRIIKLKIEGYIASLTLYSLSLREIIEGHERF